MTEQDQLPQADPRQARADWERRVYQRLTDTAGASPDSALPAPTGLRAADGVGHVRLSWDPVPGAAGYLVERTGPGGPTEILQHGGSDVPAVPGSPFADTGMADGVELRYRVAAVAGADHPAWAWSAPVTGRSLPGPAGEVSVVVDAGAVTGRLDRVWRMVGSERLTQLRFGDDGYGNQIGAEFAGALRLARTELGVTHVRAHAILHDDNQVVTLGGDGQPEYDFSRVEALYDQLLELGLRPVVELSFMPAALARDPRRTVFAYRGIISPPRDWQQWYDLVRALAQRLVERYGADEVADWPFEVWNEPNLAVFWSGTQGEYLRLYDEAARAVKDVLPRLRVGGPATAAAEWVEVLAEHAARTGVPLDFVTTHTYGNLPVDVRPALERHGLAGIPVWWTEWGVGSTHFGPIHDGVIGAPFVLSGFAAVQGRLDALAYWVISDHFEELGRPETLFHNGFGLLTVGNLRKPRYWAARLAAEQGDELLGCAVDGDGAGVLVQAWATRHADGTVDVLIWNGTVNGALAGGDPRLDRRVRLTVHGLPAAAYGGVLARVDARHSNILAGYPECVAWPDEPGWARLREADRLAEQPLPRVLPDAGVARFEVDLPMPGVARIRLTAGADGADQAEER
jgi:xylan 1,4-beta-xylosidase